MKKIDFVMLCYLILPFALLIIGDYIYIVSHEQKHERIYSMMGNISSTINISFVFDPIDGKIGFEGKTIPENKTIENYKEVMMLHTLSELTDYENYTFFSIIVIVMFFFSILNLIILRDEIIQEYLKKLKENPEPKDLLPSET